MFIRRIATSACALCLAIPATAVAAPGANPPEARGPYGTPVTGAPALAEPKGPYGSTPAIGAPALAEPKGPYGSTQTTGAPVLAQAKGPYGSTPAAGAPLAAGRTTHAAAGPRSDALTAWRAAAIAEAALLAAVTLASMGVVAARGRAARIVT
jgi:hypothetical protein